MIEGEAASIHELAHRRELKARDEVTHRLLFGQLTTLFNHGEHRGLEAAKAKIKRAALKARQGEAVRAVIPHQRLALYAWPTRIAEPQHPRDLIKGLTRGVVAGVRHQAHLNRALHSIDRGVSTAHHQGEVWVRGQLRD